MLVTVDQIKANINELPADYAEHVHITLVPTAETGGTAEVESFSDPKQEKPWVVHIEKAKTVGYRSVTCTCPATRLCKHITAFYAVAKHIKPVISEESAGIDTPKKDEGKETPSEEIKGEGMTPEELEQTFKDIGARCEKIAEAAKELTAALAEIQK